MNPCHDVVRVSKVTGKTVSDIKLTTIQSASGTTNVVNDQVVNGIKLTTSPVEEYSFGNLTGGSGTASETNQVVTTSRQTGFVLACDKFVNLPSSPPNPGKRH